MKYHDESTPSLQGRCRLAAVFGQLCMEWTPLHSSPVSGRLYRAIDQVGRLFCQQCTRASIPKVYMVAENLSVVCTKRPGTYIHTYMCFSKSHFCTSWLIVSHPRRRSRWAGGPTWPRAARWTWCERCTPWRPCRCTPSTDRMNAAPKSKMNKICRCEFSHIHAE